MTCPSPSQSTIKVYQLPTPVHLRVLAFRTACLGILPEIANFPETVLQESMFRGGLLT